METIEYGRALYYPHIIFESRAWMRTAALYHDNLARIVPAGSPFQTDDLNYEEERTLEESHILEQHNIISSEYPDEGTTSAVANAFLDFATGMLTDPQRRNQLVPELPRSHGPYRIYKEKIDAALVEVLEDLGLARRDGDKVVCEPVTGAMYMLFLARHMAKNRPIVTDNAVYQALLHTPVERDLGPAPLDKGLLLASAILRTVVPLNIETVPIEDLIKFREDHTGERNAFYNTISQMASNLGSIQDPKELQEAIDHYTQTFNTNMETLRTKLKSINVACGTGVFTLSVPAALTAGWGLGLTNPFVLLGAGSLVMAAVLVKPLLDKKAIAGDSGIAYVHSMETELGPRQYAERFVELNLAARSSQAKQPSAIGGIRRYLRGLFGN